MGCGKSKHDVASGNLLTQKLSKIAAESKKNRNDDEVKKSQEEHTVNENSKESSNIGSTIETAPVIVEEKKGEEVEKAAEVTIVESEKVEVKEIENQAVELEKKKEEIVSVVENRELETRLVLKESPIRVIPAPNGDRAEGTIDSAVSGVTEYETPLHDDGKENALKESVVGKIAAAEKEKIGAAEEPKPKEKKGDGESNNDVSEIEVVEKSEEGNSATAKEEVKNGEQGEKPAV